MFGQVDTVRLCTWATCALALAAMIEANCNVWRSTEALELTNAQALTAVKTVALAAATDRLRPTKRVFI